MTLCHSQPKASRKWLKGLLPAILLLTPLMLHLRQLFSSSNLSSLNSPGVRIINRRLSTPIPSNKTILFWTPFYAARNSWELLFRDTISGDCPLSNCRITQDRRLLPHADAVVFHLLDIQLNHLPYWRAHDQIWVLFSLESPAYRLVRRRNLSRLNGLFNWTMTYRWDSDVPVPYGLVLPRAPLSDAVRLSALPEVVQRVLPQRPTLERSRRPRPKKGLVAWMVSNCDTPSRREQYVTDLRKHIQVSETGYYHKHSCQIVASPLATTDH